MIEICKILCPVDFSPTSDHALNYAIAFAQRYGAELELLHVVQSPVAFGVGGEGLVPEMNLLAMHEAIKKRLFELTQVAAKEHAPVSSHMVSGTPFVEIVRRAREKAADLIVMGSHGHGGLAHMLIGSVAERVVRKAPCPVLTVKPRDHEFVMP